MRYINVKIIKMVFKSMKTGKILGKEHRNKRWTRKEPSNPNFSILDDGL